MDTYPPEHNERLLRLPEVMERSGLSRSSIYRQIARGAFPAPVHVGGVSVWPNSEFECWIENLKEIRDAG